MLQLVNTGVLTCYVDLAGLLYLKSRTIYKYTVDLLRTYDDIIGYHKRDQYLKVAFYTYFSK